MDSRWLTDPEEFRRLAPEWDQALSASGSANPFLLSDFILAWWAQARDVLWVEVFVLRHEGRLAGGLPLCARRGNARSGFARVVSYVGGPAANYTEPLYAAPQVPLLPALGQALAARADWDVLHLSDLRPECPLVEEYQRGTLNHGLRAGLTSDHANWAIDLSGGAERYLSGLSKKLRRDLRSKRRHAQQRYGPLELRPIRGVAEVGRYFDVYREFSRRSFEERGRTSTFEDAGRAVFFREFLTRMELNQRLDAHVLLAGDTVLAVSFGYRFGPGFHWVLTAFNYECHYVRPGYLLIEELLKELTQRGETQYNWYGDARFYKSQWCNRQTPLYRLILMRPTWRSRCFRTVQGVRRMLRPATTEV